MNVKQIESLGPELAVYLDQFSDCFGRSEPCQHLVHYVRGQLMDLDRKSIEPIALANGVAPRTLQEFLATDVWDEPAMRDRLQQIIARDHLQVDSLGILDESGHPKDGNHTACVSRQYCGRLGKVANCVMTVNLSLASFDTKFRVMLDSVPFLPEGWEEDVDRRRKAGIPDDVHYRPKYDIGLEELDQARANGVTLSWLSGDAWYGQKPKFISGLRQRGQRFVLDIPRNFRCFSYDPGTSPRELPAKEVRNLVHYSKHMMQQEWTRVYLKDTEKGPQVWDAKTMPVWLELDGEIVGPWWLVWARDVTDPSQEKFFLSNASAGVPFEVILHVGFARWPVERCLQDEKSELGMSHFEVRKYLSLCRHLILTMVSHLFLARQTQRLRGEKSGDHYLPSAGFRRHDHPHLTAPTRRTSCRTGTAGGDQRILPTTQCRRSTIPHQDHTAKPRTTRRRFKEFTLL